MPTVETLIKLVNVKINSNAALNTNKYKHGDTIRLNVVLTYRNYGDAIEFDDTTIACDYIQFYKNTDLGTWVSVSKITPFTITEPTGTFNFEANTGSSIDVNSFDVSNSITGTLEVKGYLDVVLENPEFGNSFKFQFRDAMAGTSGYKYSYDIPADRIVSLNDNAGNRFNVKTDVDSIFRNGVSIKNYIPYRFVYSRSHTFSNSETPVNLTMDGGIYSQGHILVLDSQEGVSIPNGPFIAMFVCPTQIKVTDTLTFVFGPDKNSNITKAFSEALAFCSEGLFTENVYKIETYDMDVLFESGTMAMVLVDPDNGFNAIYPINASLPDYEMCLDIFAEAISAPVTFSVVRLSDDLDIPSTPTDYPITQNDLNGNGEQCSLTLESVGDCYGFDGYVYTGVIDGTYAHYTNCKIYYKQKYINVEDVISAIGSLPHCWAYETADDVTNGNPLTSVTFKAIIKYRPKQTSRFGYTMLKALIGGTVME
jgi:hypothetical protein